MLPHIVKGLLTHIPPANAARQRRASTGGTGSARYCYSVWTKHLASVQRHGLRLGGSVIAELGPGDSLGTGIAALISGAGRYIGLDRVRYANTRNLDRLIDEVARIFTSEAVGESAATEQRAERLKQALSIGYPGVGAITYFAPWQVADVEPASLDLLFSHTTLQYMDDLNRLNATVFRWLKPGGFCSHVVDLGAMEFSPYWNGHWAYGAFEWQLVRGKREYVPNRRPISAHIEAARAAGFELLEVNPRGDERRGLPRSALSAEFATWPQVDLVTSGLAMVLRKPPR
jgi:SAM-dependent methyltransferase